MNRDELLQLITTEDVINILKDLGSNTYKKDTQNNIYFRTVCHDGDSDKLYYFTDSKMFQCFTCCGSMSLYDVIMSSKNIQFIDAYKYLCDYKHISYNDVTNKGIGLQRKEPENTDLDFLQLHLYKKDKQLIKLPVYNEYILNMFDNYFPLSWSQEGIIDTIADYFNIKFYINQNKAIIPHYDIYGQLVGIRARSFNQIDIDNKRKYMPISIQGLTYRYPMNFNLYGIYQNKNNIQRIKKAIIFEGEKSVMLYGSYFGQENNISLATCGMSFSLYQKDLLLSLGVEEVVIAYDKQYQIEYINDENINRQSKEWKEYEKYIQRLIKITKILINYCNVSIIVCWDNTLKYKDAPIDCNKETFTELYENRYCVSNIEELQELIK